MRNKGLLTKMLSGVIASAMAVSLLSAGTFAQGKVSKAAEKEIVYHAALGIQTAGDNNKQDESFWLFWQDCSER